MPSKSLEEKIVLYCKTKEDVEKLFVGKTKEEYDKLSDKSKQMFLSAIFKNPKLSEYKNKIFRLLSYNVSENEFLYSLTKFETNDYSKAGCFETFKILYGIDEAKKRSQKKSLDSSKTAKSLGERHPFKNITDSQRKISWAARKNNPSYNSKQDNPICKEYWISRGSSIEEAEVFVEEHKKKCVQTLHYLSELHGYDKAVSLRKSITEKITQTKSNTNYPPRKWSRCHFSKASCVFFDSVFEYIKNFYGIDLFSEFRYGTNGGEQCISFEQNNVYLDCSSEKYKICIEYNGCAWHPKEGDVSWIGVRGQSYENTLERDKYRIYLLENLGYNCLVVWDDCLDIEGTAEWIMKLIS